MTAPAIGAATRPNLTLGLLALAHSLIHMQSALMPLVYIAVIDQFGLDAAAIGVFIAVTTTVAGLMQLSYGFLTRYVARPVLIGAGQIVFGVSLMLAGLATTIGQLLAAISAARVGASPQHPVGNGILSDAFPAERRGFAISTHIAGGNVGTILVPFLGGALLASGSVLAHHSLAGVYDIRGSGSVSGTLTKVAFTNPHGAMYLDVKNPDGTTTNWVLTTGSANTLANLGFGTGGPNTVKAGDAVTITYFPARNGKPLGFIRSIVLADKREIQISSGSSED